MRSTTTMWNRWSCSVRCKRGRALYVANVAVLYSTWLPLQLPCSTAPGCLYNCRALQHPASWFRSWQLFSGSSSAERALGIESRGGVLCSCFHVQIHLSCGASLPVPFPTTPIVELARRRPPNSQSWHRRIQRTGRGLPHRNQSPKHTFPSAFSSRCALAHAFHTVLEFQLHTPRSMSPDTDHATLEPGDAYPCRAFSL